MWVGMRLCQRVKEEGMKDDSETGYQAGKLAGMEGILSLSPAPPTRTHTPTHTHTHDVTFLSMELLSRMVVNGPPGLQVFLLTDQDK